MLVFPNCKINLGLNVLAKRPDGYHELETIFFPLPFTDVLESIPSTAPDIYIYGTEIPGLRSDNLCIKAWHLLKKDFPDLPPVEFHLYKNIPMGAGLGGGSGNGAFTLKLLNDQFSLGLSTSHLLDYARQLGSDCPFFIINTACFAGGRGEVLEPLTDVASDMSFVIVHPGIHVSTKTAFENIIPQHPQKDVLEVITQPMQTWREELKNDFEPAISALHPEIATIKNQLYESGAVYASMTGSGSAVYGIFEKDAVPLLSFDASWRTVIIK